MEKVSAEEFSSILKKDTQGEFLLNRFRYQEGPFFFALIEKASSDALSFVFQIKDYHHNTPLHRAAEILNDEAFLTLIKKISLDALSEILLMKNHHGDSPLSLCGAALASFVPDKVLPEVAEHVTQFLSRSRNVLVSLLSRCESKIFSELYNSALIRQNIRAVLFESAFNENLSAIQVKHFNRSLALDLSHQIWKDIKRGQQLLPNVSLRKGLINTIMSKPAFSLMRMKSAFFFISRKRVPLILIGLTNESRGICLQINPKHFFSSRVPNNSKQEYIQRLQQRPANILICHNDP